MVRNDSLRNSISNRNCDIILGVVIRLGVHSAIHPRMGLDLNPPRLAT